MEGEPDFSFLRPEYIIYKHDVHGRNTRHPEHLPNHIEVVEMDELTDDEIDQYNFDYENEYGYDELLQLGDGKFPYLTRIYFKPDESSKYDYILHMDEPDKEEAKRIIASSIQPKSNHTGA